MIKIPVPGEGIETLFGSYDENLRFLETLLNVRIRTQGQDLLVEGDGAGAEAVERIVLKLASLVSDGYRLGDGDVRTAAQLISDHPQVELRDYFVKSGPARASGRRQVVPKSVNQRAYLDAIDQFDIVFGIGPPGRRTWRWPRRSRSCSRKR
jgi:phosphate starvation-inducible PhoH-like protein